MLRSLDHPNVLKLLGVMYKDKKLNLVTEFVDGGTLKDLLHDTSKHISNLKKVNMARDISSGMVSIHAQVQSGERWSGHLPLMKIYGFVHGKP